MDNDVTHHIGAGGWNGGLHPLSCVIRMCHQDFKESFMKLSSTKLLGLFTFDVAPVSTRHECRCGTKGKDEALDKDLVQWASLRNYSGKLLQHWNRKEYFRWKNKWYCFSSAIALGRWIRQELFQIFGWTCKQFKPLKICNENKGGYTRKLSNYFWRILVARRKFW